MADYIWYCEFNLKLSFMLCCRVVSASDQVIPDQLAILVEKFAQHMSRQKQLSAQISSFSDKGFKAVDRDITSHSKVAVVIIPMIFIYNPCRQLVLYIRKYKVTSSC